LSAAGAGLAAARIGRIAYRRADVAAVNTSERIAAQHHQCNEPPDYRFMIVHPENRGDVRAAKLFCPLHSGGTGLVDQAQFGSRSARKREWRWDGLLPQNGDGLVRNESGPRGHRTPSPATG
jgi:hypothetical protein